MASLVETISQLRTEGYTEDFNLEPHCLECREGQLQLLHDEFHIDKVYRFDDNSDPDDQSVLYAISSDKHKIKGLLVNGYGIYSDELTDEMLKKLQ